MRHERRVGRGHPRGRRRRRARAGARLSAGVLLRDVQARLTGLTWPAVRGPVGDGARSVRRPPSSRGPLRPSPSSFPIGARTAPQLAPGTSRSRSRIRPRSQRLVDANAGSGPLPLPATAAAARERAAPRAGRAVGASGRRLAADGRAEVHERGRPVRRPIRRDDRVRDPLETRRPCIGAGDAAEHSPHVRVHRPDGLAEGQGGDGTRGVRTDARQSLQCGDLAGNLPAVLAHDRLAAR